MADPNKWLGLMRWSMKYCDGTTPPNATEMSQERRDFLDKVLKEAVIDESERIKQILRILDGEHPSVVYEKKNDENDEELHNAEESKITEEDLELYKEALIDELLVRIDQIDNAQNFVKMNGFTVCLKVVNQSPRPALRASAMEVISVVVQNNPFCQNAAHQNGMLKMLCDLVKTDPDTTTRVKAFMAISCLIRNHQPSQQEFLSERCYGKGLIEQCLESEDLRLQRKALFLSRSLTTTSDKFAREIVESKVFLDKLSAFILSDDIDLCESSVDALVEIMQILPDSKELFCQPSCQIIDRLNQQLSALDSLDEEEKRYLAETRQKVSDLRSWMQT
uniref:Uncharacterized protein AlNc14C153G7577 n=1 Tax=Albugo laibachii Nc14 TaxID=890382 RepID=F0WM74_9STRA|nr:conserved hypothetical protein [Albugo laibachii Nc14]|eukprot:CCA22402.1 conserved hypothetical protein [Albugo laibachii Nc14]